MSARLAAERVHAEPGPRVGARETAAPRCRARAAARRPSGPRTSLRSTIQGDQEPVRRAERDAGARLSLELQPRPVGRLEFRVSHVPHRQARRGVHCGPREMPTSASNLLWPCPPDRSASSSRSSRSPGGRLPEVAIPRTSSAVVPIDSAGREGMDERYPGVVRDQRLLHADGVAAAVRPGDTQVTAGGSRTAPKGGVPSARTVAGPAAAQGCGVVQGGLARTSGRCSRLKNAPEARAAGFQ